MSTVTLLLLIWLLMIYPMYRAFVSLAIQHAQTEECYQEHGEVTQETIRKIYFGGKIAGVFWPVFLPLMFIVSLIPSNEE